MSLSAAGFLALYAAGLVLALVKDPIFGIYSYLWTFYNEPSMRWWGADVPDLRYSLIAALVTFLATFWSKPATVRPAWYSSGGGRFLIALVAWMWIQSMWAVDRAMHWEGALLFTKYLFLFAVLYRVLESARSLGLFVWGHVGGCAILAWIAYRTQVSGRLESVLSPGIDDSNLLGMQLTTGLVFAGFLFVSLRGVTRWAAFGVIPFMLNGIILTASRSAFVGLLAAGVASLLLAPRARRRFVVVAVGLGAVLLFMLSNDIFWDRVQTLSTADQAQADKSVGARVELLGANWRMALDYPLGAGHRGNEVLSPAYVSREFLAEGNVRSAHNTVLAVLVDHGFPGAALFVALQTWMIVSLVRLRRASAGRPLLVQSYIAATGGALAAYLVCGMFVNLFKAEVGIWLVALVAVLNASPERTASVGPRAGTLPVRPAHVGEGPSGRSVTHGSRTSQSG